jgi:hypothetical protein
VSTDFVPSKRIAFERIKGFRSGRIRCETDAEYGVFLTDGKSHLRVNPAGSDFRTYFSTCAGNNPTAIVLALERHFHVRLIPDYDKEFLRITRRDRREFRLRREARRT